MRGLVAATEFPRCRNRVFAISTFSGDHFSPALIPIGFLQNRPGNVAVGSFRYLLALVLRSLGRCDDGYRSQQDGHRASQVDHGHLSAMTRPSGLTRSLTRLPSFPLRTTQLPL